MNKLPASAALAAITFDVRGRPEVEVWLKLLEDAEREAFVAGFKSGYHADEPKDLTAFKEWQERGCE